MSSPIRRASIAVDVGDDRVEVEHARLQHLLAAEGEQLAGQRGRAPAARLDLLDVPRRARSCGSSASAAISV